MKRTHVDKVDHIKQADDLERAVVDKRYGKRSKAKKNRRNRHYVKNILRNLTEIQNGEQED